MDDRDLCVGSDAPLGEFGLNVNGVNEPQMNDSAVSAGEAWDGFFFFFFAVVSFFST